MVPGEGPIPCVGLVLGEAPGRVETEKGRPFVGPSGALLDQAFATLGVSRDELYITNVVKEWPRDELGATRRPYEQEIQLWYPVLKSELEAVSPGTVLLLGKTAAEHWGFTEAHRESGIFAASHPAWVLRQMRTDPKAFEGWLFQINPFVVRLRELESEL